MNVFRILIICVILVNEACSEDSTNVVVITHATVIDGTGAEPRARMTLVIEGKRITALKQDGKDIPNNARFIDATGKYVIPGLWDMHVQLSLIEFASNRDGLRDYQIGAAQSDPADLLKTGLFWF